MATGVPAAGKDSPALQARLVFNASGKSLSAHYLAGLDLSAWVE